MFINDFVMLNQCDTVQMDTRLTAIDILLFVLFSSYIEIKFTDLIINATKCS